MFCDKNCGFASKCPFGVKTVKTVKTVKELHKACVRARVSIVRVTKLKLELETLKLELYKATVRARYSRARVTQIQS